MEEQQKELDGKWLQEGVQRMMVMLESDSRNESFARVCVASFMTRMNPTVAETDDVKTAVSEAVTNSIVHGYPYEKGLIRLVCAIEKDTLTVQIRDWGAMALENVKKARSQCTVNLYAGRSVLEWVFALWKHLWMI